MQVSTHDQDTPAANKQHKIEDQLPEYFNHGRILKKKQLMEVMSRMSYSPTVKSCLRNRVYNAVVFAIIGSIAQIFRDLDASVSADVTLPK